jgi:phosphoglycolate phosphatase
VNDAVRPHAFRLVVFDLDGTLVDSRRDLAESANQLLRECGAPTHAEETIGRMVGDGAAMLVARAFAEAGVQAPPDALQRFLAIYNRRLLSFTGPYPGIPEVLDALSSRVMLAVLTNKPLRPTQAILAGLGLARHFGDRIVGGDGPFPRKPDPAGLRHLVERAHAHASDTLMVGDSVVDLHTARAASVRCFIARYGFGFVSFPIDQTTTADRLIDCPADLLAVM